MKITNLRLGFATNSSSSHSVVILPEGVSPADDGPQDDYGWGGFILSSPRSKINYLAAQLMTKFVHGSREPVETRRQVIERITAMIRRHDPDYFPQISEVTYGESQYFEGSYVDHQSVLMMDELNEDFVDLMATHLKQDNVAILGGNDNDDYGPTITGAVVSPFFDTMMTDDHTVITKRDGGHAVVFDAKRGTKIRLSVTGEPYHKANTPELVDVKITDFCGKGCNFCYQGSTTEGLHAPLDEIKKIADQLAELRVFEVAIGGGEPTDHPDFLEIMRYFRSVGIVPNFTTMSNRWLKDAAEIQSLVGAIGVSCMDAKGLRLADEISSLMGKYKVMPQHVVGSVPIAVTANFLEEAWANHYRVLLLGFKEVGFGQSYSRHDFDKDEVAVTLATLVTKTPRSTLSVDTAMVDSYPELMDALKVPFELISSPEGKFSCYIDAVKRQMGPSSYAPDAMSPLPGSSDAIKELFATY